MFKSRNTGEVRGRANVNLEYEHFVMYVIAESTVVHLKSKTPVSTLLQEKV